jgi:hypothetical protein
MKAPDLKQNQMVTIAYIIGMGILLFIVYKLLVKVGLIKSAAKKRAEAEQGAAVEMLRTDDYWKPDYYKGLAFKSIGSNAATLYAQTIRAGMRGFGTNEEKILVTFGKIFNKCNVSEISEKYATQYGRDLQADLLNDLSDKEVASLMNIVNGLPNK